MEATWDLKLGFLNTVKKYHDRKIISNIDNENLKWFYIQIGKNKVKDCFHLELTEEGNLEFHIEAKGIISKSDCEKAFNYFKKLHEFGNFDFENGDWNDCIKGYVAPYTISGEKLTKRCLLSAISKTLKRADKVVTVYGVKK